MMKTKLLRLAGFLAAFVLAAVVLWACESDGPDSPDVPPVPGPVPEEPEEKPEVHVLTETTPEKDYVLLEKYDQEEGVLEMYAPLDKLPKPGDVICSGITKQTPFGFMARVEKVSVYETESGTKSVTKEDIIDAFRFMYVDLPIEVVSGIYKARITLASASIQELLHLVGADVKQWLELVPESEAYYDDNGNKLEVVRKENKNSLKLDKTVKVDALTMSMKHTLSIAKCAVYLDSTSPFTLVFGHDIVFKSTNILHLTLQGKLLDKKGDFLNHKVHAVFKYRPKEPQYAWIVITQKVDLHYHTKYPLPQISTRTL